MLLALVNNRWVTDDVTSLKVALGQRGIATRSEPLVNFPWFNRLEVPEVARWACESARAIILATLNLIPPGGMEDLDPIASLRRSFGNHAGFREPESAAP